MKLLLLSLFAASLAAETPQECFCTDGTEGCNKGACALEDGGSCILATWNYTMTKDSKEDYKSFAGCEGSKAHFDACKEGDLIFTAGKNFTWNSVCCKKSKCNSESHPVNTTRTRKVCPTCFVFSSKPCEGNKTNCIGSLDYCLTISGEYQADAHSKSEPFFGQGCATPSAKIFAKGTNMTFGDLSISIKTIRLEKAKDGASQVPGSIAFTVLLPYLLWLLMDKFLY